MRNCLLGTAAGVQIPCVFNCTNVCRRNFGGSSGKISPPDTGSLAGWWRYGVGITESSRLVSQWNDQSGNGRHLKQPTGTNQPSLQDDGSILFDGIDNYLKCDAFTLNQPETVYMLGRQVTWTDLDYLFDGEASASTMGMQQRTATPSIRLITSTATALVTAWILNTYAVLACVFNSASSVIQVNSTASTGLDAGTTNAGGFTLGARGDLASFGNIQVKEVMVYSVAHNSDQRAAIISYLARVGGLAL